MLAVLASHLLYAKSPQMQSMRWNLFPEESHKGYPFDRISASSRSVVSPQIHLVATRVTLALSTANLHRRRRLMLTWTNGQDGSLKLKRGQTVSRTYSKTVKSVVCDSELELPTYARKQWKAAQNWPLIPLRAASSQEEGTQTFSRCPHCHPCAYHAQAILAYPAHRGAPGTITLTDTSLFFTSFTSSTRAVTIDLKTIVGVKRSSLANGLRIRWSETRNNATTEEGNEKFLWVSGRDDLFARLIGSQSRRWLAM